VVLCSNVVLSWVALLGGAGWFGGCGVLRCSFGCFRSAEGKGRAVGCGVGSRGFWAVLECVFWVLVSGPGDAGGSPR